MSWKSISHWSENPILLKAKMFTIVLKKFFLAMKNISGSIKSEKHATSSACTSCQQYQLNVGKVTLFGLKIFTVFCSIPESEFLIFFPGLITSNQY
jgi:hypothetical protein